MAIAVWGPMVFSVSLNRVYPFDDFSLSSSVDTEEQEREGCKQSTYIKGLNLDEIGFSIPLIKQRRVNIRSEIINWLNTQNRRVPYMLIINNKPVTSSKFLLTSVKVSNTIFDKKGDYIRANIEVTFKEFVRKGKKQNN
ncbi:phage tail protein [Clostridium sporogenes]|uniref:phage tail protein n=1 Tax=Clostridium sporogenes TaxID=1509 RepID=UPI0006677338|nr:phage tail protein [Clostridium sporogenes]